MNNTNKVITYLSIIISLVCFSTIMMYEYFEHSNDNYLETTASFDIMSPQKMDESLKSKDSFLVFFGSVECDPCAKYAPTLLAVSKEYDSSTSIVKYFTMDKDYFLKSAENNYGVMVTPTTLVIKNGEIIDRVEGGISAEDLRLIFENII